ncbi:MAG: hypothetical protein GKS03_01450 [Alphaproteobacteria bacterium]|nr:hypothetical protein [Alphaproteobacteria bacterium]
MADDGFSGKGFLWRWGLCLVLVLVTFNPTGFSYYAWVMGGGGALPMKVLTGIVLLAAYAFIVHATWESLGPFGVGISVAFFAAVIWVLVDFGLLSLDSASIVAWIVLVAAATILAVGMSFSLVRRKVTGQIDVDDVDD